MDEKKRDERFEEIRTFADLKETETRNRKDLLTGINQWHFRYKDVDSTCPHFYQEGMIFTASYKAKKKVLKKYLPPHPEIRPVSIGGGNCILNMVFACATRSDLGPYLELGLYVPIQDPKRIGSFTVLDLIPGFELVRQVHGGVMHAYSWRLVPNSFGAYVLGYDFYGMAKFRAHYDFQERSDRYEIAVSDEGKTILKATAMKIPVKRFDEPQILRLKAYHYRDKVTLFEELVSETSAYGRTRDKDAFLLELGREHPLAAEVRDVLASDKPMSCMYMPQGKSILYEPSRWAPDVLEKFFTICMEKHKS
jgi:hypothetical protein